MACMGAWQLQKIIDTASAKHSSCQSLECERAVDQRCDGLGESSFRIGRSAYAYLSASRLFACFGLPSWTPRGFAAASEFSPLAQAVVAVSQQGREQVADNTACSGLDLGGHRHARYQVDEVVVYSHLGAVERDAGRIAQFPGPAASSKIVSSASHRLSGTERGQELQMPHASE